jgi:hypothetical protein
VLLLASREADDTVWDHIVVNNAPTRFDIVFHGV